MTEPAILVEMVSKAYRIGQKEEIPDTFMGAATGWFTAPLRNWRRLRRLNTFNVTSRGSLNRTGNGNGHRNSPTSGINGPSATESDILWALRDISFDVNKGEVIGIIGRNGAGKSTLLKILSRITEPNSGRAVMRGRVSSLLEVGTGFHPELTGRENIYMNGTLLGMKKREIDRKFDEIVDFSGIEQFLDTPVKRYSSGMQIRLAFSVAAHLDPEILIVDEVLAVGDLGFQKKCTARMNDIAREHRTILFVSHNMSAIRSLCTRAIVLEQGCLTVDASTDDALAVYTKSVKAEMQLDDLSLSNRLDRTTGDVRFTSIRFQDEQGLACLKFSPGDTVRIQFTYKAHKTVPDLGFLLEIWAEKSDSKVTSLQGILSEKEVAAGTEQRFTLTFPSNPLRPDDYRLYVCLGTKDWDRFYDVVDDNVALPRLSISSVGADPHLLTGHFSIPWSLQTEYRA